MAKTPYLPAGDSGKAELLEHFAAKLPQYTGLLEISPRRMGRAIAKPIIFWFAV
jgi:hypothetical protein